MLLWTKTNNYKELGEYMLKEDRLQKVIAQAGITSRRKAEQYIVDGRVKVNGVTVTELGTKVTVKDQVEVDGVPIERENKVYYVLYKPRGYVSTVDDDKGRETVIDLLTDVPERIFPIGRLDYASSGILLLTNDGDFAHLLMHPRHEVEKVYIAKIKGIPSNQKLDVLRTKGVESDGETLRISRYKVMSTDKKADTMLVEVRLHEGKNRHIRRMFEQLGHPVSKLRRETYGTISLDKMQPGTYRELTRQEVHQLKELANKNVEH